VWIALKRFDWKQNRWPIWASKNPAVLIMIAALILGLAPATVTAQEKFGDSRVQVTVKAEVVRLDDVEGHTLVTFQNKGYNLKAGTWMVTNGTSDLVKGNGTGRGYTTTYYPDGVMNYTSWEGKTTTTVVDGKSIATSEGTWRLISGTGEWRNREGGGTWKSRAVGDGVSFVEWEGEWRPKR
jgi:hypothetical protein